MTASVGAWRMAVRDEAAWEDTVEEGMVAGVVERRVGAARGAEDGVIAWNLPLLGPLMGPLYFQAHCACVHLFACPHWCYLHAPARPGSCVPK
eukprot:790840-Pelagomonas_calceolata.AAC.2